MSLRLTAVLALAMGAFGLSSCAHTGGQALHDDTATTGDFDEVMSFEPEGDAEEAVEPLPVHEFDPQQAEADGATQVIDGDDWLNADDGERNDMLLDAEEKMPPGSTIVIVVATGDVWIVPPEDDRVFPETIRAWTEEEYDDLPLFTRAQYYGESESELTVASYQDLTRYAMPRAGYQLAQVNFIHDVGPAALHDIYAHNGMVGFVLGKDWRSASPAQRTGELMNIQNYLAAFPQYKAPDHKFELDVSIPWGMVYPVVEEKKWQLVADHSLHYWNPAEIYAMPASVYLPDLNDRPSRGTRLDFKLDLRIKKD